MYLSYVPHRISKKCSNRYFCKCSTQTLMFFGLQACDKQQNPKIEMSTDKLFICASFSASVINLQKNYLKNDVNYYVRLLR